MIVIVQRNDFLNYTGDSLISSFIVILALKPSFKKRPLEIETYAAEGGNTSIICNPEAAPRPKFVWKKDENVIGKKINFFIWIKPLYTYNSLHDYSLFDFICNKSMFFISGASHSKSSQELKNGYNKRITVTDEQWRGHQADYRDI